MNSEELFPKIMVFHDAVSDLGSYTDALREGSSFIRPWSDWYHLGKQTHFTEYPDFKSEFFPSAEEWSLHYSGVNNPFARQTAEIFYSCTSEYVTTYGVTIPNWSHYSPFVLTHSAKSMDGTLAMQYHTDFKMAETENPGYKFWVTCLLYVNDDYEGGEIAFKVFPDENRVDEKDPFVHLKYKPRAGDMLILPAHHPYYHGVCKTLTSEKLFLRMFWGYEYDGSERWLAKESLYGKEKWAQMEKERLDREFRTSKWMMGAVEEVSADNRGTVG